MKNTPSLGYPLDINKQVGILGEMKMKHKGTATTAGLYQIQVEGTLDSGWADWLSGFGIKIEEGNDGKHISILTGQVPDQAALRGILIRIWDMNLTLVSIHKLNQE